MSTIKKDIVIDILRCVAIFILLIAHIHDYIDTSFIEKYHMFFANACLSIFALISGFLLPSLCGNKSHEIKIFITRRIKRIYILYLPVLIIFFIVFNHDQKDITLFIQHALSLQLLTEDIREPYWTLWYIGFIVPLITAHGLISFISTRIVVNKDSSRLMAVTIMYFLLYVFIAIFGQDLGFDLRIAQYLPAFILGWMLSKYNQSKSIMYVFCLVFLVKLSQGFAIDSTIISTIKSLIRSEFIIMFPFLLLKLTQKMEVNNQLKILIEYASFSSFAVYLVHRPILEGVMYLNNMVSGNNLLHALMLLFGFVILFPISFFIQKSANRLK